MPRYLLEGSYVGEGLKGILKVGGSSRRNALMEMIQSVGGKLEAMYFAFGERDVFGIVELPDNATAAALSMAANASGAVEIRTTVLLTPEEVDAATKKSIPYRPPGQ